MSLDELGDDPTRTGTSDDVYDAIAKRERGVIKIIQEHIEEHLKIFEKDHKGEYLVIDIRLKPDFYKEKKAAYDDASKRMQRPYIIRQI